MILADRKLRLEEQAAALVLRSSVRAGPAEDGEAIRGDGVLSLSCRRCLHKMRLLTPTLLIECSAMFRQRENGRNKERKAVLFVVTT
jgi:hypothetical protein